MKNRLVLLSATLMSAVLVAGCASDNEPLAPEREYGTAPELVEPAPQALPKMNPAKAVGWPEGRTPVAADGLAVTPFALDLDHPRWLLVLPNGDVLVAESDRPEDSLGMSGIVGWVGSKIMNYGGSDLGSPDRITLLRDADGDGVAEYRSAFLTDLRSPFGMALVGETLYVANADALVRFDYTTGSTELAGTGDLVTPLPGMAGINHHWTKNVVADASGETLYVAVGSNSNIGENGLDAEINRAAILAVDPDTGSASVFASGLRNPVGMDWEPATGSLWTVVNERDALGDQLVPDYLTEVVDGGFYGWPWTYWGDNPDPRVEEPRPAGLPAPRAPDYALGAHTASLGLAFYDHSAIDGFAGGALIGQRGSWNRTPVSGYKVVFVAFEDGRPVGNPRDVLTGFLNEDGQAMGRPVGVAVANDGAVLVADDVGKAVWRVQASQ